MSKIHPLILCGGVGTRLWPLSRSNSPKQFQPINGAGSQTFFQATVARHMAEGFHKPLISVSDRYLSTVKRQLAELKTDASIIAEPVARNTGPAVLASAFFLHERDPDAVMAVLPSDHVIHGDLNRTLSDMLPAALDGRIALFGIEPAYPETGYGYIVDGGACSRHEGVRLVSHFVEKPPLETAQALISEQNAFWASGVSLFSAGVIISEYEKIDPQTYRAVKTAYAKAKDHGTHVSLCKENFTRANSGPTEGVIFEKTDRAVLAPAGVIWNDVGAWNAFHTIGDKDDDGNVLNGDVLCVETSNSYIRGSGSKLIATVGVSDLVVVDTDDALLITTRDNSQKVKAVITALQDQGRCEIVDHRVSRTNWGQFARLESGDAYRLNMLKLDPQASVSLPADDGCYRLFTASEGEGLFKSGAVVKRLRPGDVADLRAGEAGSIRNRGETTLTLMEVQYDVAPELAEPSETSGLQKVLGGEGVV
ncbi:mannose-1-phosphate guanylyltransferase [Roseibium sediminicola]|uniref:Sugar phosphate nucleotidyltransferase n=1 Tax=Roseibium sediminicola TaxID=2933272 RepID=A0ABT0GXK3_9HYPH|nr:sugar phosphate nucleotidyltransferase [Roseibium sp. CAU 1639]MCK7614164.1 sugar phosphate nucleotidyltransferase [Roseibium sp. CAU 1639]